VAARRQRDEATDLVVAVDDLVRRDRARVDERVDVRPSVQ
jgi:hypothetical protein